MYRSEYESLGSKRLSGLNTDQFVNKLFIYLLSRLSYSDTYSDKKPDIPSVEQLHQHHLTQHDQKPFHEHHPYHQSEDQKTAFQRQSFAQHEDLKPVSLERELFTQPEEEKPVLPLGLQKPVLPLGHPQPPTSQAGVYIPVLRIRIDCIRIHKI